jgi:hypothetical protein
MSAYDPKRTLPITRGREYIGLNLTAGSGLQDQVLLGAPRTFELAASAKW